MAWSKPITAKKISIGILIWLALSYLLIFPDTLHDEPLTREDGVIEWVGALAFLMASVCFFYCFLLEGRRKYVTSTKLTVSNGKYYYLLLSILFLVAFGEEVSWGQRIFGWTTPVEFARINQQGETNLHNLNFFKGKDRGTFNPWSSLKIITAGRLFIYFWLLVLVLIPILNTYSDGLRKLFTRISLPVAPLWIGVFMLTNFILAKGLEVFLDYQYYPSIGEIKETNYALIILVWGGLAVQSLNNKSAESRDKIFFEESLK